MGTKPTKAKHGEQDPLLEELNLKELAPDQTMRYGFEAEVARFKAFDEWLRRHNIGSRAAAFRWFMKLAHTRDLDPRSF